VKPATIIHVFCLLMACSGAPQATPDTGAVRSDAPRRITSIRADTTVQSTRDTARGLSWTFQVRETTRYLAPAVVLRLVGRNSSRVVREAGFAGSAWQAFDFVVLDSAGRELWSRLHGYDIELSRYIVWLKPGDSIVFSDVWPLVDDAGVTAVPGRYTIQAYLTLRRPSRGPIAATAVELR
jgi:hypothetical protein